MLKTVLTICFSVLFTGCIILGKGNRWERPQSPKLSSVSFEEVENGFFLSAEEASKLANNTDELKAYIKKLEALVETMKKHNR